VKDVLILFDVDGTLCDTSAVDAECFALACAEELGVPPATLDWSAAPEMTDAAIVEWLWREHRGRVPSPEEYASVHDRLLRALRKETYGDRVDPHLTPAPLKEHLRGLKNLTAFCERMRERYYARPRDPGAGPPG
jgi:beta-phosphoglucomutase-like phosphatase (HAD superfamily)